MVSLGFYFGFLNRYYLVFVVLGLAVNWFGDSFDGSIARYRKRTRPKYGYYIDKIVDAIVVIIFGLGLGLSGFVRLEVSLLLACVYPVSYTHLDVYKRQIEPATKSDEEKMSLALERLVREDPIFRVTTNQETNQTIIHGMGELHLEIMVDRMKREFGVVANVGKPQVAYRETIKRVADQAEGKYIRQSGGRGQYGHCWLRLEPNEPGKGFEFINEVKGGAIPREYIPSIQKGVEETMKAGLFAGYPVVDIKVAVYDGSFHEVDSSEAAFKIAGAMAFKEGFRKGDPILLEPIMKVDVETPDSHMGDVTGCLLYTSV